MKITIHGNGRIVGGVSAISSASPVEVHDHRAAGVAAAIHYPECWDTAAYPTVESALAEVYAAFKCIDNAAHSEATPAGRNVTTTRTIKGVLDEAVAEGVLEPADHLALRQELDELQAVRATPAVHGEDKGYWIQGGRKHYVGPAIKPADHSGMPSKETVKRLFNMHGGPVDGEGWCLNENGLNDFLRDLFASRPA